MVSLNQHEPVKKGLGWSPPPWLINTSVGSLLAKTEATAPNEEAWPDDHQCLSDLKRCYRLTKEIYIVRTPMAV